MLHCLLMRMGKQEKLIDLPKRLSTGLLYRPDFITRNEETEILSYIEHLPLEHAEYRTEGREYTAKRRHVGFGWGYDYEKNTFVPGPALPPWLRTIQVRIAKWLDIPKERI